MNVIDFGAANDASGGGGGFRPVARLPEAAQGGSLRRMSARHQCDARIRDMPAQMLALVGGQIG